MYCQKCGTKNPVEANFCNSCGNKFSVETTKLCQKCDAENEKTAIFRNKCGNPFSKTNPSPTAKVDPSQSGDVVWLDENNGYFIDTRDKKKYVVVKIGTQEWLAENLNVHHFRNGEIIPEATTREEWKEAGENEQPVWCYYNNDPENGKNYGKLYNWFAVNDPRNICPEGWHVSTDDEWTILTNYLGGEDIAAGKLKESGFEHWLSPNEKATIGVDSQHFRVATVAVMGHSVALGATATGGVLPSSVWTMPITGAWAMMTAMLTEETPSTSRGRGFQFVV